MKVSNRRPLRRKRRGSRTSSDGRPRDLKTDDGGAETQDAGNFGGSTTHGNVDKMLGAKARDDAEAN